MKVTSLRLQNFRSFSDSGQIDFGQINVLIGANNSGKTSILRGLHHLQHGLPDIFGDVRIDASVATVDIGLSDVPRIPSWGLAEGAPLATYQAEIQSIDRRTGAFLGKVRVNGSLVGNGELRFQPSEPNHFIVPFLSKRKTTSYMEDIREQFVIQVSSDMSNLAAKLSRLANPLYPAYEQYAAACKSILGFVVTAIPSPGGQRPGVYLPNGLTVPIDQMGEGVPNIVYLLAQIAVSKDKLFLMEEPENDLHPTALKALLDLVAVSAEFNQFVISTHSNIVVSYLCSRSNSMLFRITSPIGALPAVATIDPIPATPESRIAVLHELGYAFSDFDLWDGWLLLEESSAERIVRDYLIPWFVPELGRIRTIAAGGVNNEPPRVLWRPVGLSQAGMACSVS